MSAIYGLFTKKSHTNIDEAFAMMAEFNKYRFDKTDSWHSNNFFMGSHLNFVVPESTNEVLPLKDEETLLVITADAIIDNRDELFELMNIKSPQNNMSDSALILETYKNYGERCVDVLIGDFAFAIWDCKKEELFCASDHVGKRALYYYNSSHIFAFSTLINPLFKIKEIKKELNENYVAEYLNLPTLQSSLDCTSTIYMNILQFPPASTMRITCDEIIIKKYWQVNQENPIVYKTDAEYEDEFLQIFKKAIKCRLRSNKNIGIMLSGGLDSASVATIAAIELAKCKKKLYGFTQIPMQGYQEVLPSSRVADETPFVEELCKIYPQVIPDYIDSNGKNAISEIDSFLDILEQPYKFFHNSYWLNEISRQAQKKDITIMLDGQCGNATVSWGAFRPYIIDLVGRMKYLAALKEIRAYACQNKLSFIKTTIRAIYTHVPFFVKEYLHKMRGGENYYNYLNLINPEFQKKNGNTKKFHDPYFLKVNNSFDTMMHLLDDKSFSHFGAVETKMSIAYGSTKRDPTRDKRVIEFCMNIPGNLFVRNGQERRLIRVAMKGILPDSIRLNTTVRGKQAADWLQRIVPDWDRVCDEISTIGDFSLERKYLDIAKIKDRLSKNIKIRSLTDNNLDIVFLIRALIFARFLRKNFPENQ